MIVTAHCTEWFKKYRIWWYSLSPAEKCLPVLGVLIWWCIFQVLGGMNADHFLTGIGVILLSYSGPKPRQVLIFLLPLLLTAIIYEAQQFFADVIRAEIHVQFPYFFDLHFFGITTPDGELTPNEWLQKHTLPILDFITGIFYIIFVPLFVVFAAYYRFYLPRHIDTSQTLQLDVRTKQIMWAFFWVNMLGYSTYYWFPAAPPWYVADYGLGPANLEVTASLAGCTRFDDLIGIPLFQEWYGRSKDVFGAIPSLHVAYPLQIVYYAFQFRRLRFWAVFYWFWVSFGAVYLNHHYILDLIWGYAYALLVCYTIDGYYKKKARLLNSR